MTYITQIDGKWYAYEGDKFVNRVYSIGSDSDSAKASGGYRWSAQWNDAGIKYVASPSASRNAAYQKAHRHGEYGGEV